MEKQRKSGIFSNIIFFLIVIIIISVTYKIFKENNFNDYIKSEYIQKGSKFTRDNVEKISNYDSYKITSDDFNDAMFYKKIKVDKNTPYRIKCRVKTKNVENKDEKSNGGANICISDTTEKSISIVGTNDWKELEFLFDSKNREEINVGFRLGSYDTNTKGEAWFSDFKISKGIENYDTNWKMGLLVFENIETDDGMFKHHMSESEIQTIAKNMQRYEKSIKAISDNKITISSVSYKIEEPIKTVSYDEENGYYINPLDIEKQIKDIVEKEQLDHIYVAIKLGNIESSESSNKVNDWIGLRRHAI